MDEKEIIMSEKDKKEKERENIIQILKNSFKYVRLIELYNTLILESRYEEFKKFILCSNVLEECSTFPEEIDNLTFKVHSSHLEFRLWEMLKTKSGENIPIFELLQKRIYIPLKNDEEMRKEYLEKKKENIRLLNEGCE